MSLILLKSATIVDPGNPLHMKKRDVMLKNGKFLEIGNTLNADNARVVELENLHISPGWFDSSVCLGEPGFEERETLANGLNAAALSGFTHIAVNPEAQPVPDSKSGIEFLKTRSAGHPVTLLPVGALTMNSEGEDLAELYDMFRAGAVAFSDYNRPVNSANLLKLALLYVQNFDGLVQSMAMERSVAYNGVVHEGIQSTRLGLKGIPALAEELQINRDLYLLEYTGGKLHIPTISTATGVRLIKEAKKRGLDVSCSVSINNLVLTDAQLEEFDSHFKLLPPLREESDRKALIKGLRDGTIDGVTSDHNPIDVEHKKTEFDQAAFGSIGMESCFGALNDLLGADMAVTALTRLKERFGLGKHSIKEGEIASLTLFDPDKTWTFNERDILSKSMNAALLGQNLKGWSYGVYNNKKLRIRS